MGFLDTNPDFIQRLSHIQCIGDAIPATVVIHQLDTLQIVYMNNTGLEGLGVSLAELQSVSPEEYHERYMNSEDSKDYIPKIMKVIKSNTDEQISYFQQVRSAPNKDWQLYISTTKVFSRNAAGVATHIITIANMIDPVHHINTKVNRLVKEASFFRQNNTLFLKLTKRERQILTCMAMGMTSGEIAEKLFISSTTADTHRRNIRVKLRFKNNYDAVKFAQAYDLI